MNSIFIRELKRYQLYELCSLFKLPVEKTISIINKLREIGIVKVVNNNLSHESLDEFYEEDLLITDNVSLKNNLYYIFNFVGVVIISNLVINCYPKYILSSTHPVKEFKQVLKVLRKYFNRKQEIKLFENDSLVKSNSQLALYLYLLDDYFENGIYTEDKVVHEVNGNGEINWNQTINQNSVYLNNNQPIYYELITRKRKTDELNYIKRVHEIVLTLISQELDETGLLDLFGLTGVNLSENELEDVGDISSIINNLEKKLNEQFVTRKRLVILSLIAYLKNKTRINDLNSLTIYGTNTFYSVWEDVCKVILNDQLKLPLQMLDLPKKLSNEFKGNSTLQELIEKPYWVTTGRHASTTFIPDIINIENLNGNSYFIIYDAKYYTAILEPGQRPFNQPGIESISKQFFYQLAFKNFISHQNFDYVKNFFIMPTEENEVIDKKQVRMDIMKDIDLEEIEIRFLPAELAFNYYLEDKKLELEKLRI